GTPLLQRAFDIQSRIAPRSIAAARSLNSLGWSRAKNGDLDGAERELRRGLAWAEGHGDRGRQAMGGLLGNLAHVARRRGDLAESERLRRRSLELDRLLRPGSVLVANDLLSMEALAYDRGDVESAERYGHEAQDLLEKVAPRGTLAARSLENLAEIAGDRQ